MVRRTLRALDGQAGQTPLTHAICEELGTAEPAALAAAARRLANEEGGSGRGFLVPLLVRLHEGGDAEAKGLFVGAGGWLALLASATANRLGFGEADSVTFGTVGGVWKAGGETLGQAFHTALKRRYPGADLLFDSRPPTEARYDSPAGRSKKRSKTARTESKTGNSFSTSETRQFREE
jgi:N-acetylglucosamine kinase-like BadF-type ATPase